MLSFALRRSENLPRQAIDVDKAAHAALKGQRLCVVWLTRLSGAGKATIANLLQRRLHALGRHTCLLDGDNLRKGLNKDLGFSDADRVENIRRAAEVAKVMTDAGLIVIASFISPFRAERQMARGLFDEGEFIEVFVDAPLDVVEARDPKGLYRKARHGDLPNFTGIDAPYEAPDRPDVRIDTCATVPAESVEMLLDELKRRGVMLLLDSRPDRVRPMVAVAALATS
jgi:bifunctional enzyme CysN/CysC